MIVADTHIIIWHALKPDRLSKKAKDAIRDADNGDGIIFCEISLWVIAMLIHRGRLSVDTEYEAFISLILQSSQYVLRGMTPQIAWRSADLFSNRDPADRIIAATAIVEGADLVTADKAMRRSKKVRTIW